MISFVHYLTGEYDLLQINNNSVYVAEDFDAVYVD